MTENKRRIKRTDIDANAPQADGYSWGETQTGISSNHEDEPRDVDGPGGDVAATVTMLDYDGSPVVAATKTPRGQIRAPRDEI